MEVAIIGFGTVGSGAYEVIRDGNTVLHVKRILDLAVRPGMEGVMTADYNDILNDPQIKIVAEAIGGLHPAREFILAALRAGKSVVTANKQLAATCYRELMETAAANGVQFRFTPSAGGGIPWLSSLKRTARATRITKIEGILNGTTNFILDKMTRENAEFSDALAQAQALGYAEKDPSADIDGIDVRFKCALSGNVAAGITVDPEQIPVFGIRSIRKCDVIWMKRQERVIRLLANLRRTPEGVALFVQPSAQPEGSLFAAVQKNFNLVSLTGDKIGTLSFYGQGAGKDPTGFALVQDLLDVAEGPADPPYQYRPAVTANNAVYFRYYVRTPQASDALSTAAKPVEETEDGTIWETEFISVEEIHRIAKTLPETAFFAALEEREA